MIVCLFGKQVALGNTKTKMEDAINIKIYIFFSFLIF